MRLKDYASSRNTKGNCRVPKSVQESIPVDEIFEDGIWRSAKVYSQMWSVSDINYSMMSDAKKDHIQRLYGAVYASLPTDCWAKFTIVSQKMDARAFKNDIMLPRIGTDMDMYVDTYNKVQLDRAHNIGNVIQHRYFIVYTSKNTISEARSRLHHVHTQLIGTLSELGCSVNVVNNNDRMQVLHNFFRIGAEPYFRFDYAECKKLGHDFRDYVCPDYIQFCDDHIEYDGHYARAMSITDYPRRLDDRTISMLLQQAPYVVLTLDVTPIEIEDAMLELESAQMRSDADRGRFTKRTVDNLDFNATVPYRVQSQNKNLSEWRTDMTERDQQMFLVLLTLVHFADSMEELETQTLAFNSVAANLNCHIVKMGYQQEDCFNTAMPYGVRRIENMRTMTTANIAAAVPFDSQDIMVPKGVCYGVNALTGNLIVGSRIGLVNGNGMVIATSGGGKSMFVKLEILAQFLRYPHAKIYVVDPENEYGPLVQALGGVVVNISTSSKTFFNPLDFKPDEDSNISPSASKVEYVLTLFEHLMKAGFDPGDLSILNRSLKNIYSYYVKSNYTSRCPTLGDLYADLLNQQEDRASQLALTLEVFTHGDLNAFAHETNIDMSNRLICFNIQSLGNQLKPVAMLSMLEFINNCVMGNNRNDPTAATWVYFDEMYLLLKEKQSSDFLFQSWKRFRKYNAYATGITQNIADVAKNDTGYALLANSEFVVMLRQSENDIARVKELYNLSDAQINYLLTAVHGEGIIKMGNSLIPFENYYPADNCIYRLMTTKPGEMQESDPHQ